MSTGPSYFRPSCPRTPHRRRSARSSEQLGFKESKAGISASMRRDLKQSATPSPILLLAKRFGLTRSFRRGLTIAATPKTRSHLMQCLTISVYIGLQILPRRLLVCTGKTPRVVVQASQLGASSCRWLHQSSLGRFFVPQKSGLGPSGRTCSIGTSLIRADTLPLSNNRSYSPGRCATRSSHGEDDRPRHFKINAYFLRRTGDWWVQD